MDQPHIGLIGVGLMGHGIARNLLKAGYSLTFLIHPGNQPTEDLTATGASAAHTPAEIAMRSDIIILCVTGSPEVDDVLNGSAGVMTALDATKTVIDCSTAIPDESIKNADRIAATGASFLDAPMTRTPKEAEQGRLNLIVGGEASVFERCRPVLAAFAESIHHVGAVGSGHAVKLLHNFVSLGFASVLAEATACAHGRGIDVQALLDVLAKGGGGGVVLERMEPFIRDGDDAGFRFTIANAFKDMSYYMDMATAQGASGNIAASIRDVYADAVAQAGPTATVPDLITLLGKGKPT